MTDDWTPREKRLMAWMLRASRDWHCKITEDVNPIYRGMANEADKLEREAAEAERKENRAQSTTGTAIGGERKGPDSAADQAMILADAVANNAPLWVAPIGQGMVPVGFTLAQVRELAELVRHHSSNIGMPGVVPVALRPFLPLLNEAKDGK